MRKITFLLFAFFIAITAVAQDSPGKRPELLLDKTVRVKPLQKGVLAYQQGYDSFYADKNLQRRYAENKSKKTDHEALANRVLKVTSVEPITAPGNNYKIELQDTINKETIFFKFNESAEARGNYYFEVIGGINYPADFYCDFLQQESNPDAGEHRLTALITEGIKVTKTSQGKTTKYIMEVRTVEDIISMLKGVTLVMENGLQIVKPEAQAEMFESAKDKLTYVATFELTLHEVSLLMQSKIISGKISKFDKAYHEGEKLRQMVKCMGRK